MLPSKYLAFFEPIEARTVELKQENILMEKILRSDRKMNTIFQSLQLIMIFLVNSIIHITIKCIKVLQSKPVYSDYFFAAKNGKKEPIVRKKR